MTTKLTVLPTKPKAILPDFEGIEVTKATVRITKAGDGLSAALLVSPTALHPGEEVFYVLRGVVAQVNHRGDPDEGLTRVHTIDTTSITTLPRRVAEKYLNEAAEALAVAKAARTGEGDPLPFDEGGDE